MKYESLLSCSGSHRYFREEHTERIAIADDSGRTPDRCDHGLLYLDREAPVIFTGPDCMRIPLRRPNGERASALARGAEGCGVARMFGMAVRCECCGQDHELFQNLVAACQAMLDELDPNGDEPTHGTILARAALAKAATTP